MAEILWFCLGYLVGCAVWHKVILSEQSSVAISRQETQDDHTGDMVE